MLILILGLLVGFIMALTGAGGGILAVPLLMFVTTLTVAQAGPVGLLAVGISAALGAVLALRLQIVRYRAALLMAAAGMLCSPLGVWLAGRLNDQLVSLLFSAVLFLVAYRTFQHADVGEDDEIQLSLPCNLDEGKKRFVWTKRCARALALFGGFAGLLSGLLGVGGGFVMVPALQRYTDLPIKSVIATSLAVIALVSLSGVAASAFSGGMMWSVALPFCGGALTGMLTGRLVSGRLAGPQLQKGFAVIAALVAIGMLSKTLFLIVK